MGHDISFPAIVAVLVLGVASVGSKSTCCQICPVEFYRDLSLLELAPSMEKAAIRRFQTWHRGILSRSHPVVPLLLLEVSRRYDYSQVERRPGHGQVFAKQSTVVTPIKSSLWTDLAREEADLPTRRIKPGPADWRQGHLYAEPNRQADCCILCTALFATPGTTFAAADPSQTPGTATDPISQDRKSSTEQEIGGQTYTDLLQMVAKEYRADVQAERRRLFRLRRGASRRWAGSISMDRFRARRSWMRGGRARRSPIQIKNFPSWNHGESPYTSGQMMPGVGDAKLEETAIPQHNTGQQTGSIWNQQHPFPESEPEQQGSAKTDVKLKKPSIAEGLTNFSPQGLPECCNICDAKIHPQVDYLDQVTTLLETSHRLHLAALAGVNARVRWRREQGSPTTRPPGRAVVGQRAPRHERGGERKKGNMADGVVVMTNNAAGERPQRMRMRRHVLQDNTNGGDQGNSQVPTRATELSNLFVTPPATQKGCCKVCPTITTVGEWKPPFSEPQTQMQEFQQGPGGKTLTKNFKRSPENKRKDYEGKNDPVICPGCHVKSESKYADGSDPD